jgi:hypothetical protein
MINWLKNKIKNNWKFTKKGKEKIKKKKKPGPNFKILKNENSRLKDAIRKKKLTKGPKIKIDKSKE